MIDFSLSWWWWCYCRGSHSFRFRALHFGFRNCSDDTFISCSYDGWRWCEPLLFYILHCFLIQKQSLFVLLSLILRLMFLSLIRVIKWELFRHYCSFKVLTLFFKHYLELVFQLWLEALMHSWFRSFQSSMTLLWPVLKIHNWYVLYVYLSLWLVLWRS